MKRYIHLIFILPFLLWLAGCDETRPGIIKKFIFSDEEQWLERDASIDSLELVDSLCCNDYYPYPLPIDATINPVIEPAGDLDYYNLQTTSSVAGWLSLWSKNENVALRIFSSGLEEYEGFQLNTFYNPEGDPTAPEYWTTLLFLSPSQSFPDTSLTVLVAGESSKEKGDYTLKWHSIIEDPDLRIEYPRKEDRWRRLNWERIEWAVLPNGTVTAALLRGPVIIRFLNSGNDAIYDDTEPKLDWHIPDGLEEGTNYRILLFRANNPKRMNISNEFEIYH